MSEATSFIIEGEVWRYPGPAGWYFVAAGAKVSAFLRQVGDLPRKGWDFVPVAARLGNTSWQTTLFPDKERGYLLAIKADVRKKEQIKEGDAVRIEITFP